MVGDSNASSSVRKGGAKSGSVPASCPDPLAFMDIPQGPQSKPEDRQRPLQQGPSQVHSRLISTIWY